MFCCVIAELVVGENGSGHPVGSHLKSSIVCERAGRTPLQIDYDVALGLRAADQHNAVRRCVDRVRTVADFSCPKSALAGMADPGSTRIPHGHVACFGKLEQALERWPPADIGAATGKRDHWS